MQQQREKVPHGGFLPSIGSHQNQHQHQSQPQTQKSPQLPQNTYHNSPQSQQRSGYGFNQQQQQQQQQQTQQQTQQGFDAKHDFDTMTHGMKNLFNTVISTRHQKEEEAHQQRIAAKLESLSSAHESRLPNELIGGGQLDYHPIKSRRTGHDNCKDGGKTHQVCEFYCLGSLSDIQNLNPLQRDNEGILRWESFYDTTRTESPASPWRSMHDLEGPLKDFMNDSSQKKLIQIGARVHKISNSCPFPVGVFVIGAPVTRVIDDPLWSKRTTEIVDAFYQAAKDTTNSKHERFISCVRILPPRQTADFDEITGGFYYISDSELAGTAGGYEKSRTEGNNPLMDLQYAKTWMGLTISELKTAVIVPDIMANKLLAKAFLVQPGSDNLESYALVRSESRLTEYIRRHWFKLSNGGDRHFKDHIWELPKLFLNVLEAAGSTGNLNDIDVLSVIPSDICAEGVIKVHVIPTQVVNNALSVIDEHLKNLPFARLSGHQIFLARMDADKWDEEGKVAKGQLMSDLVSASALVQVSVTVINGYEVMTKS